MSDDQEGALPGTWLASIATRPIGTHSALASYRYRNLDADLVHAHAIEYSLPAEIGAIQSHRSRSTKASTFRGTLKYESLAGTKFDVPDVSRLAPLTVADGGC